MQDVSNWKELLLEYGDRSYASGENICTDEQMVYNATRRKQLFDLLLARLSQGERPTEPSDPGCICEGNWRQLVKENESQIGKVFVDSEGKRFRLFGIVHGGDDYYYGMYSRANGMKLLSCVSDLDGWDFTTGGNQPREGSDESETRSDGQNQSNARSATGASPEVAGLASRPHPEQVGPLENFLEIVDLCFPIGYLTNRGITDEKGEALIRARVALTLAAQPSESPAGEKESK